MNTENRIGLGAKLESGRKAKGWSQQEAAKRTKLRLDTIRKLEAEHFDEMPSLAYARGFIRIYARELGLDGISLLKEMDGGAEDDFDINDLRPEDLESIPRRVQPPQLTPQTIGLVLLVVVILLALTVGIMGLIHYGRQTATTGSGSRSALPVSEESSPEVQGEDAVPKAQAVDDVPKAQPVDSVPKAQPVETAPQAQPDDAVPKAQPVGPNEGNAPKAEPVVPRAQPVTSQGGDAPAALPL